MEGIREGFVNPDASITGRSISTVGTGVGNLTKLLPTGTVFLFQFLNPVFTNNGQCDTIHKYLSGFLIAICGFFCFFSSFTDSCTGADGLTHYGFATSTGIWPATNPGPRFDLPSYKLIPRDFVHAFLSLIVFAALALLDSNTVECFFPSFESAEKDLLMALPLAVGAVSSAVFMWFPNTRHGIGYPNSSAPPPPANV